MPCNYFPRKYRPWRREHVLHLTRINWGKRTLNEVYCGINEIKTKKNYQSVPSIHESIKTIESSFDSQKDNCFRPLLKYLWFLWTTCEPSFSKLFFLLLWIWFIKLFKEQCSCKIIVSDKRKFSFSI